MADFIEHNFRDHRKGRTFNGKRFTFTTHPSGTLLNVTLTFNTMVLLAVGSGMTIIDPATWIFEIDQQIINWDERNYNYKITTTSSGGVVKSYIVGTWRIIS